MAGILDVNAGRYGKSEGRKKGEVRNSKTQITISWLERGVIFAA